MRTHQEIEAKIDELAYFSFCYAAGGDEHGDSRVHNQLSMLYWMLDQSKPDYNAIHLRGKTLYDSGRRYAWNSATKSYVRNKLTLAEDDD